MLFRFLRILPFLLGLGLPASALAQTGFPFQLLIQQPGNPAVAFSNGGTANLISSAPGTAATITVKVTYTGRTHATIASDLQLAGSPDFTVTHLTGLPITLNPNDSFTFQVTVTPTTSHQTAAQVSIPFVEAPATATGTPVSGNIVVNFTGQTPQFAISYTLPTNGNAVGLNNGDTIPFPATPVNTSSTVTIDVGNVGAGAGVINSVSVTGAAFHATGLPLFPVGVNSGADLRFGITYSPLTTGSDQGTLQVVIGGQTFTAQLQGTSVTSNFSYTLVSGTTVTPIVPGQTISLPGAQVGTQNTYTVQVTNNSASTQVISVIAISGAGLGFTNPVQLPVQIAPQGTFSFTFTFAPTQPGPVTAQLRVGADIFTFTVTGLGPQLSYSYSINGTSTDLTLPGTIPFTSAAVGQTSTTQFTIKNTGTSPTTISSVSATGGQGGTFAVQGLPALPVTLQPGDTLPLSVSFSPTVTGQITGTLLVNSQQFTLSGFGSAPPPLPSFQITGPSGQVKPFDQPAIGVTLAQPYPLPVTGTLTLKLNSSSFGNDPAVQFSSGGQTTTFTIPANQTQAVFANGSTQIRLQTGTVAGTITIVPTFQTSPGNVSLTPGNATPLALVVPSEAPVLLTTDLASSTVLGFSVNVTGYSTTRSLTKLDIQVTPVAGVTFPNNKFTVAVDQAASVYFNNSASQNFGGQFTVTIPFTLSSSDTTLQQTAFLKIGSVTVTATNDAGTSNAVTLTLH